MGKLLKSKSSDNAYFTVLFMILKCMFSGKLIVALKGFTKWELFISVSFITLV